MVRFSTKANTLAILSKYADNYKVLPQTTFTVKELKETPCRVLKRIKHAYDCDVIVRSSSGSEDNYVTTNAGKYKSIQDVKPNNVIEAANKVADSYDDNLLSNQILVQPMLKNIKLSGVIFTKDPNTGGYYFVINYDDTSNLTYNVTSGLGSQLKTKYVFWNYKYSDDNSYFNQLILAAKEIMQLFQTEEVDIEFAFTDEGLYILQARPLIVSGVINYSDQQEYLAKIHSYLKSQIAEKPDIIGHNAVFSIMTDWNPAEMIGVRPRQLALSLYKKLISDKVWAQRRYAYGYNDIRGTPLIIDFYGFPYVDVRASFNSFVPEGLSDELTNKLVNYYLNKLQANPWLHDKVEFEIVYSTYNFDTDKKLSALLNYGFSKDEVSLLKAALKNLTKKLLCSRGPWIKDIEKIDSLERKHNELIRSNLPLPAKIYWLIENCIKYGTEPFVGLARMGFIGVELLKSMVDKSLISEEQYQGFMLNLDTVVSEMTIDLTNISKEEFISKYGHLRPGTYDITAKRYDQAYEQYFGKIDNNDRAIEKDSLCFNFDLSSSQKRKIMTHLSFSKFESFDELIFSIKRFIEIRERAKFVFTKALSDTIELIAQLGEYYGFSREEMSYCSIDFIDIINISDYNMKELIHSLIKKGKAIHKKTCSLIMPPVIINADDIYAFSLPEESPNFITLNKVQGDILVDFNNYKDIKDKILLIEAADPGYDWIFSKNIKAFITAYGGANSHMAIRAGELNIPAVIGVGEKSFKDLQKASRISIDCTNKQVIVLC